MRVLTIILVAVLSLSSCNVFKAHKEKREELKAEQAQKKADYEASKDVEEIAETESSSEMAPVDPIMMQENDSLLLSYERTPCFGRCPVFKIKVYESGYTTYQGVNFVEYMGYFYTRIDGEGLNTIYQAISEADFFNKEDNYDNENITDLPAKIFMVDAMGMNKRIVARTDIPSELNKLATDIEKLFEGTEWKAVKGNY